MAASKWNTYVAYVLYNTYVVANTIIIICSWWHFHFRISICLFLPIDAVQDVFTVTAVPRPTNYYSENAIFYRAICTPCAVIFSVVWLCAQRVNKMKNCTSKVEIITARYYLLYHILSLIILYDSYAKILINTYNGNVTMSLLLWYIVTSGFECDRTFLYA